MRDIVSDSSHFLQISGGKEPCAVLGEECFTLQGGCVYECVCVWREGEGESFQVHKPPFLPLFLRGQVLTLGNTRGV